MVRDRTTTLRVRLEAVTKGAQEGFKNFNDRLQESTQNLAEFSAKRYLKGEFLAALGLGNKALFFFNRGLQRTIGLAKRFVAVMGPGAPIIAGLAALAAVNLFVVIPSLKRLWRSLKEVAIELDAMTKAARVSGITVGQFFGERLAAQLAGIGNSLDGMRSSWLGVIRAAKSGDQQMIFALGRMGIGLADINDKLSDHERLMRLIEARRRNPAEVDRIISQLLGPDFARRLGMLAEANNHLVEMQSNLLHSAGGAEDLVNELVTMNSLIAGIGRELKFFIDPVFDAIADKMRFWNDLLGWIQRSLNQVTITIKQMQIALESLGGNFETIGELIRDYFPKGSITSSLQNLAQPAGGFLSLQSGGFSAVQAAMRQDSLLSAMLRTAEASERTARNTERDGTQGNSGEGTNQSWYEDPLNRAAAYAGMFVGQRIINRVF